VIAQSLEGGWSVPQTATAIREKLLDVKKWQATMLARTDLISLKNGGSFAAALQLGQLQPVYKQWVSARDDRVRPTHVEANGQVVKLDAPFEVGEAHLAYPGDPSGPDEEVINCRCTQIYSDSPEAAVWTVTGAGAWDESEHPRDPGGEGGGEFVAKEASAGGVTGDEAIAAWEEAYPAPIVSNDQMEAVSAYQGAWYAAINHKLRDPADFAVRMDDIKNDRRINSWDYIFNGADASTRPVKLEDVPKEADNLAAQLDRVMAQAPADMVSYRYNYGPSVAGPEATNIIEDVYGDLEQLEGKTIADPGFQSTTLDEHWATKRLAGDPDGILHRIHIPKGTPSSYLPILKASPNFDEEKELLLARGLKMKAIKVQKDGQKYTIDWEVQP
jgi:hypothetical protein